MISLRTRKYHLTDPLFRKVIGENAIRAHVLIKPSISHGITGIRRLSVLGDLVSQGRGMWRLGTLGQRPAGAPGRPLRGCRRRGARRPGSSGPCHPFVGFGRLPLCVLWRGRNPGRWPNVSEVVPRPGQVPLSRDLRLRETEARQGRLESSVSGIRGRSASLVPGHGAGSAWRFRLQQAEASGRSAFVELLCSQFLALKTGVHSQVATWNEPRVGGRWL